jgi:hypothetical protein
MTAKTAVELHGPTMRPFLRDGDQLTVEPCPFEVLRRGDIVTIRTTDRFPTARIARLSRDQALVTADAWPDFHAWVGRDDILGKVVRRRRGGRDLSCESWTWRAYTVIALLREALRARSALIRRKRAQFVLA